MGDRCSDDDDDTPPLRRLGAPRRHTAPRGVPLDADVTPVFDLLERELAAPEHEVIRRSQRSGDDPATYADLVKLARELAGELSPPTIEGTSFTGITGYQGPTRWRGDGSSPCPCRDGACTGSPSLGEDVRDMPPGWGSQSVSQVSWFVGR